MPVPLAAILDGHLPCRRDTKRWTVDVRARGDPHRRFRSFFDDEASARTAAHEELVHARLARRLEHGTTRRRDDGLREDVRRPRGAADAVRPRADDAHGGVGRERRLHRALEIDPERQLAELTVPLLGELRQARDGP